MTSYFPPGSLLLQEDAIGFSTMADVEERRRLLNQYLWQADNMPTTSTTLSRDFFSTVEYEYGARANLSTTEVLWIDLGEGMRAASWLMHPIQSNGCLFIYHSGHNDSPTGEDYGYNADPPDPIRRYGLVIPALIRCGFTVLTVSMPIYGAFRNPVINGVTLTTHDQMFDAFPNPMRFFVEPVIRFLNLLATGFRCVSMMGLSGGGWTTTICAALDPRIKRSYPVAGSVPIWLRPEFEGLGDEEQVHSDFYSVANYTELYVMGSVGAGRRQLQILNEHDDCCFYGTRHTQWVPQVKGAVAGLGEGSYDFHLDQVTQKHRITRDALARILADHAEFLSMGRLTRIASEDR